MNNPFDIFHKELISEVIGTIGDVRTDIRVAAEPLSADLFSMLPPKPSADGIEACGLLGKMAASGACFWEPHSTIPKVSDFKSALRKLWGVTDGSTSNDLPSLPEITWLISSGRPGTMLKRFGCRTLDGWPRGFYQSTVEPRLRVVAVIELPRRRDTLLLRLFGRGVTLLGALDDLEALPEDVFEWRLAEPIVLRWAKDISEVASHDLAKSKYEEKVIMRAREWLDQERREQRQKGLEKGREEGLEEGLERGFLKVLIHQFERRLNRELADGERETLRLRLDALGPEQVGDVVLDSSAEELETWLAQDDEE